jgi:hypothetical protein
MQCLKFMSDIKRKVMGLCLVLETALSKVKMRRVKGVIEGLKAMSKISLQAEKIRAKKKYALTKKVKNAMSVWLRISREHRMKLEFRQKTFMKMETQKMRMRMAHLFVQWKIKTLESRRVLSVLANTAVQMQKKHLRKINDEIKAFDIFEKKMKRLESLISQKSLNFGFEIIKQLFEDHLGTERLEIDRALSQFTRKITAKVFRAMANKAISNRIRTQAFLLLETKCNTRMSVNKSTDGARQMAAGSF